MKLKEWEFDKHLTEQEMKIVVAKGKKRAMEDGKDTVFLHNGSLIPPTKIENFKRRKCVRVSSLASPSAGERVNLVLSQA
jgi:hypothetical protein